jgi:hypothetical protein
MTARELSGSREDSPMSMTQPMTTLTRGQCAPLLQRSSSAPRSTLPQRSSREFLRDDLRRARADYFANPSLKLTRYGMRCKPGPRHMVHHRSPGLRRLPPQAG